MAGEKKNRRSRHGRRPLQRPEHWKLLVEFLKNGGAEGIRTLDLLDAIEARSQLRHGPTGNNKTSLALACGRRPERQLVRNPRYNGEMSGFVGDEVSFRQ